MAQQVELIIKGGPRLPLIQALREFWAYRNTVFAFAERDVRVKYKQAILGVGWAIVQPLIFMVIFSLTFGRFLDVPGGNYPAFSLAALVPWTFAQTGVSFGANALIANSSLVRKVYFPREVPVFGSIAAAGVDFGIGIVLFFVVGPFIGARFSFTWFLAPLLGIIVFVMASGISLALAALNAYYRDVRYLLPFALQVWLFASPVAYPLTSIPSEYQAIVAVLNPVSGVLEASREMLALGKLPDLPLLALSTVSSIAVFLLGYRIFKSLEPNFGDVL